VRKPGCRRSKGRPSREHGGVHLRRAQVTVDGDVRCLPRRW
jgi:hypothetical protein